jgi:MFS transporter, SHS family, lactate transporter
LQGALSRRIGWRLTIVPAALLSLPVLPLWVFGETALVLGIGALLMQICVQGAWAAFRPTLTDCRRRASARPFPASSISPAICWLVIMQLCRRTSASGSSRDYSWALSGVAGAVAVTIALLVGFGVEPQDVKMGVDTAPEGVKT